MSAETVAANAAVAFQVNGDDLGPLFVDRLRLSWSRHCPLARELSGYRPGSRPGSPGLDRVASHPAFAAVARAVTGPDFRMLHRTGGGATPVSVFGAYRNREAAAEALATVSPSFNGSYLFQHFPSPDDYLDWWVDTVASKVEEAGPNYLPPPTSLESLTYVLHAVDAFRRASFHSMLAYQPTEAPFITAREFSESMSRSLQSQDLRWLLPAFVFLTPGLDSLAFEPRPEHLETLAEHDFLIPTKNDATGEDIFLFGEAGKAMGVEFYRTWMMALGFDTAVMTPSGERVLHRAFLAPTALANHLVRLEPDRAGRVAANHQAMTARQVRAAVGAILEADLAAVAPAGASPGQQGPTAEAAGSASRAEGVPSRKCPACGAEIAAAARFCPSCGRAAPSPAPSQPQAVFCPGCGDRVRPGAKFCGSCGTAVASG